MLGPLNQSPYLADSPLNMAYRNRRKIGRTNRLAAGRLLVNEVLTGINTPHIASGAWLTSN
jgi:hypothetical protein